MDEKKTSLPTEYQQPEQLKKSLQIWRFLQGHMQAKWHRILPFGDYFVDRLGKARLLCCGEGASIYDSALVLGDVKVRAKTWIGPFTILTLDGSGGLESVSFCDISAGIQIYPTIRCSGLYPRASKAPKGLLSRLASRCYIGPNAVIAQGVTIGDGCIIGVNSLVLGDIPPGSKAYGTPCQVVSTSNAVNPKIG